MRFHRHHPRHSFALTDFPTVPSLQGPLPVYRCAHCGMLAALSKDGKWLSTVGFPPKLVKLRECAADVIHPVKVLVKLPQGVIVGSLEIPPDESVASLQRAWVRDADGVLTGYLPSEASLEILPHRVRRRPAP